MRTTLPEVLRSRPIDATGWFWALVLLLAGWFYRQFWPVPGALLLAMSPVCFFWQFAQWRSDASIKRSATMWCRKFYPDAGGTPIVDFMIAVAHETGPDFGNWSPDTALDDLIGLRSDELDELCRPDPLPIRRTWILETFEVARIPPTDLSQFSGITLGDAIDTVLAARSKG